MWLLLALLSSSPALAETPPTLTERHEVLRLSEEMDRLAQRNAWTGVERTYRAMLAQGLPLDADHHLLGAAAARERGDVARVRERLLAAHALGERRDVIEWLYALDDAHGWVVLSGAAPLVAEALPFVPEARQAIEHAATVLEAGATFEGYLPAGAYRFGDRRVVVEAWERPLVVTLDDAPGA